MFLLAGLLFAAWPAASALAGTVGQTGGDESCFPKSGTVFGDTNYVVPTGGGTITSFSFQSTSEDAGRQIDFLVLRPVTPPTYTVIGETGTVTLSGTGHESFPANPSIAVQGNDILAFWVGGNASLPNCLRSVTTGGGAVAVVGPDSPPTVGQTVTFTEFGPTRDLNESANLDSCPAGQAAHPLRANTNAGTITGLFCVNPSTGIGTYTQDPFGTHPSVSGTGIVHRYPGTTQIAAFGSNLDLTGQRYGSTNQFAEFQPSLAIGTFSLG